ncbi:MAG: histidine triad nucleotide-binding protein [Actinomycetota bacterium]
MADCLFCKIAARELGSEIVTETDNVLAFKDINPGAPTHVLVIPKEHITSAQELDSAHAALLAEMFGVMADIAAGAGLDRGHRLVTNVGPDAGQSVHHLHFHVLGGRPMSWPPG